MIFSAYRVLQSDADHEAKDGYEWRTVTVKARYDDKNANMYGASVRWEFSDFYDANGNPTSQMELSDGVYQYTVNYNGVAYTDCMTMYDDGGWSDWVNGEISTTITYFVRVPIGYDGATLCLVEESFENSEDMHISELVNENTLYFRFAE